MTVLNASGLQFIVLSILQPSFLAVLHLVVQTQVARNETNFLIVSVILVTVVTDSTVQVGLLYKNQTCLHLFSIVPFGFSVGWGQGDRGIGSYVCRCLGGYQGDGKNCTGKYL